MAHHILHVEYMPVWHRSPKDAPIEQADFVRRHSVTRPPKGDVLDSQPMSFRQIRGCDAGQTEVEASLLFALSRTQSDVPTIFCALRAAFTNSASSPGDSENQWSGPGRSWSSVQCFSIKHAPRATDNAAASVPSV